MGVLLSHFLVPALSRPRGPCRLPLTTVSAACCTACPHHSRRPRYGRPGACRVLVHAARDVHDCREDAEEAYGSDEESVGLVHEENVEVGVEQGDVGPMMAWASPHFDETSATAA